jgi:hypothetical protein
MTRLLGVDYASTNAFPASAIAISNTVFFPSFSSFPSVHFPPDSSGVFDVGNLTPPRPQE